MTTTDYTYDQWQYGYTVESNGNISLIYINGVVRLVKDRARAQLATVVSLAIMWAILRYISGNFLLRLCAGVGLSTLVFMTLRVIPRRRTQ